MKRGQIKMGETIAILFIFFVLILFGLVFYFQWQKSSFERQKIEVFSEQSISKSLLASFLPELVCSKTAGAPTKDCIDIFKLEKAADEMEDNLDYYFDIFGLMTLRVERIYILETEPGSENSWVLYNQTPATVTRKIRTSVPVSLFDPIEKKYSFGVLYVDTFA